MSRPVRNPDVADLRAFCAAADLGSLGRAAVRLHVSQPALTKRLQGLERLAGVQLLLRSPRGVTLTPAGRRLYVEARRLLEQADAVEHVMVGLRQQEGPVRLAASHSATEAIVAGELAHLSEQRGLRVELLTANSNVVRGLVAEGRADLGVVASRPDATPNPAVREVHLADDVVVCAVPRGHPWAQRGRISRHEFLRTPMVVRDRDANARWTVDSVLRREGLQAADPLVQAPTPLAARREALTRNAPVLLSRHVLTDGFFAEVDVAGVSFPRRYALVLPAIGELTGPTKQLADRLKAAVADW